MLGISGIVPTLNEETSVARAIGSLRSGVDEVLIVDGGSDDRTRERSLEAGADRVLVAGGGLFAQLHRGAAEASFDVLLFHYADGLLPPEATSRIRTALSDPSVEGGAFDLSIDGAATFYRVLEWGARFRNRWLAFGPFGDQSIFVRRSVFFELGGFSRDEIHSDHELARALVRRGTFRQLPDRVLTSSRRWERHGRWTTLLSHWRETVSHVLLRRPERRPTGATGARRVDRLRALR